MENYYSDLAFKLNSIKQAIMSAKRDGFSTIYIQSVKGRYQDRRYFYLVNPLTRQSIRLDTL